ncbi:DUF3465 domain-containing protein [bacterium]|nr:DUF3465 domain-containing protein [bacterium]
MMEVMEGRIVRLLKDDTVGDQHQRFVIEKPTGGTVLVVHNIDIAPRIEGLYEGAPVIVYGEFEWNDQGGLMHWTHRDPFSEHEDGWIEFEGVKYG